MTSGRFIPTIKEESMALDRKWKNLFESYWNSGEWTLPIVALNQLRNNPASFLKKYPILNMFDCAASGPTQFYFVNYGA
jgi:hypothetical protein